MKAFAYLTAAVLAAVGIGAGVCASSWTQQPPRPATAAQTAAPVPLQECYSSHYFLSQIQLDVCAEEQETEVEHSLSQVLATESTYWSTKPVASVQTGWARYARAECSAETAENVGGTAYGMLFSECAAILIRQRLAAVQAVIHYLHTIESPMYRAGSFPVSIEPTSP